MSGLGAPEADRGGQEDAPAVGALGKVEQPVAESLEDEMDNQENIISQVSDVTLCALIGLSPNLMNKPLVLMKCFTCPILVKRS